MPMIDKSAIEPYRRQVYPGQLRARTDGYAKLKLSDAIGLTQFGIGEVTLPPGAASGLPHWHEKEDEFMYVLEGEVTIVEGDETYTLGPGQSCGWPAGRPVPHTAENRSDRPARFLELGTRTSDEVAHYAGIDMIFRRAEPPHFFTRDGRQIPADETPAATDDSKG
jgi:uncharacterized cupin superfamily protein